MAMGVQSRPGPASAFASPELQSRLRLLLDRVIAALLLVAGLALIVALASYEPTDPSLNTSTREAARNLAMLPGALTADLLLQVGAEIQQEGGQGWWHLADMGGGDHAGTDQQPDQSPRGS